MISTVIQTIANELPNAVKEPFKDNYLNDYIINEAKEIIKHKRTGKIYDSKADFDADVADPNTDTTADDFRQDLEIKVTRAGNIGAKTKK